MHNNMIVLLFLLQILYGLNLMDRNSKNTDIFSLATLLYARLRKTNSRVIDVAYLMQDANYALHVIELALSTHDQELKDYAHRLKNALGFQDLEETTLSSQHKTKSNADDGHISFSIF